MITNQQLVSLNTALQASNLLLHETTNKNLAETNQIKEIYIGRYMDQCSDYITKLEGYRKKKPCNFCREDESVTRCCAI
jgi:hypothetical protein